MADEQQTPREKLAESLKDWGIDLDAFQRKLQSEGEEARTNFDKLVSDAQERLKTNQEKMDEKSEKVQSEVEEFGERMSKAWGSMMEGFAARGTIYKTPKPSPKSQNPIKTIPPNNMLCATV